MNLSNQTIKDIINKFYELFFVAKYKYLVMYPNGTYVTYNKYDKNKTFKELRYWQIESHLKGEFTLGVFAAKHLTKFICFDVDIPNPTEAKWAVYQLVNVLIEVGVPEEHIHISTSGNKGYHVDIYFSDTLQNSLVNDFYKIVMGKMDLSNVTGDIELRPTNQGLKLPLGRNFKNKNNSTNKCWYVNYNQGLKPIKSLKYILEIEQINPEIIKNIVSTENNLLIFDKSVANEDAENIEDSQGFIDQNYKPLINYSLYSNEGITLEYARKIEEEGLKSVGTRNGYLLILCRYYKYLGMTEEENISSLKEWMCKQDRDTYRGKLIDSYKHIEGMVKIAYEKDIQFIVEHEEIKIGYNEMMDIIKAKSKNEKLLLYAMTIHSKKYADKTGKFYMTYNQMVAATGLSEKTTRNLVNKLETQELIHIVERDRKILNDHGNIIGKRPNIYKITINNYNEITDNCIIVDDETNFNNALLALIDLKELHTKLPRRHYEELRSFNTL